MILFTNKIDKMTSNKGHRIFAALLICLISAWGSNVNAQSSSLSGVGVLGSCSMSFFDNHHFDYGGTFTSPGVITSSRTAGNTGLIYFNTGSSWTNADELQYIDGYVVSSLTSGFTFPIGHNGAYKPLAIAGGTPTTAAYWNGDVASVSGANTNTAIAAISNVDYWEASGSTATTLTLTWDMNSNIGGLTGSNIANLTIAGWNGTNWDVIPSSVDANKLDIYSFNRVFSTTASALISGSITSTGTVDLNNYEYFSFGSLTLPFTQFIAANNGIGIDAVDMFLYPNPATSFDNISVVYHINEYESADIVIFDMKGQVLYTQALSASMGVDKIDGYPHVKNGTYMVGIVTNKGTKKMMKVVVVE